MAPDAATVKVVKDSIEMKVAVVRLRSGRKDNGLWEGPVKKKMLSPC